MEQYMKSFPIGKKYSCEEEWWHSPNVCDIREELDTWKERQKMVFGEQKETWIEQANEDGEIFVDKYLHPQCEYIRVVNPNWTGMDEETSKEKRKQ